MRRKPYWPDEVTITAIATITADLIRVQNSVKLADGMCANCFYVSIRGGSVRRT